MTDDLSTELAEKAHRLIADHRVVLLEPGRALVNGDHASYTVTATSAGVHCTCPARAQCSHCLAAMARWAEPNGGSR